MSAFISKVGDLSHEDHDIPKGSKQEGPVQFYSELLRILWKWPFYYFPIMEKLTYSQVDVIPGHWRWLDNQWRMWIREAQGVASAILQRVAGSRIGQMSLNLQENWLKVEFQRLVANFYTAFGVKITDRLRKSLFRRDMRPPKRNWDYSAIARQLYLLTHPVIGLVDSSLEELISGLKPLRPDNNQDNVGRTALLAHFLGPADPQTF